MVYKIVEQRNKVTVEHIINYFLKVINGGSAFTLAVMYSVLVFLLVFKIPFQV